jgi:hypothetical protein
MICVGGTDGGMSATTQPATPAKHGTTDVHSIADMAIELTATTKIACDNCSATDYTSCHFTSGGLTLCEACYRCVAAAKRAAMPPTRSQQLALADWIRGPSRSVRP